MQFALDSNRLIHDRCHARTRYLDTDKLGDRRHPAIATARLIAHDEELRDVALRVFDRYHEASNHDIFAIQSFNAGGNLFLQLRDGGVSGQLLVRRVEWVGSKPLEID